MAKTKNMLAVLLIITIIISFMGTLAAITSLTKYKTASVYQDKTEVDGKVSVYVIPPPVETEGKVAVTVLPENGG